MNIRRIEKEDLPMIAELAKDETIKKREDICFKHSKICLSEYGEVLCFFLLRERSLIEFFNGKIPTNENVGCDAEEGDECWIKEDIEYYNKHYEVIAHYCKDDNVSYTNTLHAIESNDGWSIGILWSIKPMRSFYNYNNIVWLSYP